MYHLDYPSDSSLIVHKDEPETNGVNGHNGVNGVNGDQNHDDGQVSVRTEEPTSSLDDFLPISVSKNAMKQRKKRARRKSLSRVTVDPPGTVTEVIMLPDGDKAESREEGASLIQPPVVVNGSGVHRPPVASPTEKAEGGLVLHAKVYNVSRKLGIESLQALALQKFEGESEEQWASEGFVKAASEVSAVLSGSEVEEGKIRDIVLNVVSEHRELINKDGMESVIRGMDLSYDLLRRLSNRGLIPV